MNRTPVADWQQLSALYETADLLDPPALTIWLAKLRAEAHPLLKQLEQMLGARAMVRRDDFLGALPAMTLPNADTALPAAAWGEGSRVGPYRLERRLGQGGMAEVWMARRDDGAFERTVAIKLLFRHPGSSARDSFAQRFARERDILASFDHPNIAALHDAGVTPEGQPWLALEYVEGETLTRWCDSKRLDIAARVRLFRQVLLAVQHAHANLVIHRDLKPGNILVTAKGEVRLLDFGIAKLVETEGGTLDETELTRLAGRPMTPQYAAPEQLLGQPLTTACDVYSLGVVLYQLLCGERPYELKLESAAQLEQSILEVEPRSPSRRALTEAVVEARGTTVALLHKMLASDLDAIVLRALAKQAAKRYASAEAFRADLDRWLVGEPVEARAPSAAYRASKFALRHKWGVGLSALAIAALIATTAVAVVMGLQAREDSARAGAARDFMLGLFKRADQEKARGAEITARELLETGRKDLLTRLAQQPRLQAELLQGIGTIQRDMGEYDGARSSYGDTALIYQRLGRPRDVAMALVEQANAEFRLGRNQPAQTLLNRAKAVPVGSDSDPELKARVDEIDGWLSLARGEPIAAAVLFRESQRQAEQAFGPDHSRTADALRGQVYAARQSRQFDEALRLLDLLSRTTEKMSDVLPTDFAALARDKADLLLSAGRVDRSLEVVLAALPKCLAELGSNHKMCRNLVVSRVTALLQLGMVRKAFDDVASLELIARDETSPPLLVATLLLLLKITPATGAGSPFERVEALIQSGEKIPLTATLKAKAMLALAEAELREGRPVEADAWTQKALAALRSVPTSTATARLTALARALAGVSCMQTERWTCALDHQRAAQSEFERLYGADDPTLALFSLNLAATLDRLGRRDEALVQVKEANAVLRLALGPDSPTYLRALGLESELRSGSGDPKTATLRRETATAQFFIQ